MTQEIMDINKIMSILPHRYPFLLVDRIIEIKDNHSIVGIKNVTVNEPQFTGHFPSRPIMPGVLMIEAMAQISAVLASRSMTTFENKEVFFMSIDNAKFRKVVEPGDSLVLYSSIIQNRGAVWKFEARAEVDGKVAAECVLMAMVHDKN